MRFIKFSLLFALFIFQQVVYSQIRIVPFFGLQSFDQLNTEVSDKDVFGDSRAYLFYGIGIEKKLKSGFFSIKYNRNYIGYRYYLHFNEKSANTSGESILNSRHIINFNYSYLATKELHLFPSIKIKYKNGPFIFKEAFQKTGKHFFVFNLQPYIGYSLSLQNVNAFSKTDNGYKNLPTNNSNYKFRVFEGAKQNPAGRSKIGNCVQLGIKVQFKSNGKDKLAMNFEYNQGLNVLQVFPVEYKHVKDSNWTIRKILNRGSFFAAYLSYPITIINKKEERNKDRLKSEPINRK